MRSRTQLLWRTSPAPVGPPDELSWTCAFCGTHVAPSDTFEGVTYEESQRRGIGRGTYYPPASIRICSYCSAPTFFDEMGRAYPKAPPGKPFDSTSEGTKDVAALYAEARASAGVGAPTACVLVCRKILMHVAVHLGADEGRPFVEYVNYLNEKHFIPPNARGWVDHIRTRSNEANHEVVLVDERDAAALLYLTRELLEIVYVLPTHAPPSPDA